MTTRRNGQIREVMLLICFIIGLHVQVTTVSGQEVECSRVDSEVPSGYRCASRCLSQDARCRNRVKQCVCDGPCGLVCLNPGRECGKVPSVRNANPVQYSNNQVLNSIAEYSCRSGYELQGDNTRRCQGNGMWSGASPSCRQIRAATPPPSAMGIEVQDNTCPRPEEIPDGASLNPDQSEYEEGARLRFTCQSGYYGDGSSIMLCLGQEGWFQTAEFECIPRNCGDPGYLENGDREFEQFTFGYDIMFTCDEGYEMRGNAWRICQADGEWSGTQPTCEPVECPVLHPPDHGRKRGYSNTFKSRVTLECDTGYMVAGRDDFTISVTRTCQADARWDGDDVTCEVVDCGFPQAIPNGRAFSTEENATTYNAVFLFECDAGTIMEGSQASSCSETGVWSPPPPVCRMCCNAPSVSNGYIYNRHLLPECIQQGFTVRFACYQRYHKNVPSPVECVDGRWSQDDPACVEDPCRISRIPAGTLYEFANHTLADTGSYEHGTAINTKCIDDGYEIKSSRTITSCDRGQWKYPRLLKCTQKGCKVPAITYNRSIHVNGPDVIRHGVRLGDKVDHGNWIDVTCNARYQLKGATTGMCELGQWRYVPECEEESCVIPDDQSATYHYQFTDDQLPDTSLASGGSCRVRCAQGYDNTQLNGQMVQCHRGWWMYQRRRVPINCSPASCYPPLIEGADRIRRVSSSNNILWSTNLRPTDVVQHGEGIHLSCDTNRYELDGVDIAYCEFGNFTGQLRCRAKPCILTAAGGTTYRPDDQDQVQWSGGNRVMESGGTATLKCDADYSHPKENWVIECDHGTWKVGGQELQPAICAGDPCTVPEVEGAEYIEKHPYGLANRVQSEDTIESGEGLRVICDDDGFVASGNGISYCENGRLEPALSCDEKPCNTPTGMRGTTYLDQYRNRINTLTVETGTIVRLDCHDGHHHEFEGRRIWCYRGGWSKNFQPVTGTCIPDDCEVQDFLGVSSVRAVMGNALLHLGAGVVHDDQIRVVCDSRHTLAGSDVITCQYGEFDREEPCVPSLCRVPTVDNSQSLTLVRDDDGSQPGQQIRPDDNIQHGDRIRVNCDDSRYETVGTGEARCELGDIIGDLGCREKTCSIDDILGANFYEGVMDNLIPRRQAIQHGDDVTRECKDDYTSTIGDQVTVTCDYGTLMLRGEAVDLSCKSTAGCTIPSDGDGRYTINDGRSGRLLAPEDLVEEDSRVFVWCGDEPTVAVCDGGRWVSEDMVTPHPMMCTQEAAENPGQRCSLPNTDRVLPEHIKAYQHLEKARINCEQGYQKNDTRPMKCEDGQWNRIVVCVQKVNCRVPLAPVAMKHDLSNVKSLEPGIHDDIVPGVSFHAYCTRPYRMQPRVITVRCMEDGSWSENLFCSVDEEELPAPCNIPRSPLIMTGNDGEAYTQSTLQSGKELFVGCEDERPVLLNDVPHNDQPVTLCQDGRWMPSVSCRGTFNCLKSELTLTGVETLEPDRDHYGGVPVIVTCEGGYTSNTDTVVCLDDGWNATSLCTENSCTIPEVAGVKYISTYDNPGTLKVAGYNLRYKCGDHLTAETKNATCVRGVWTSPPENCRTEMCEAPAGEGNLQPPPYGGYYGSGVHVTITCAQDYIGQDAHCRGGNWELEAPSCRQSQCSKPEGPDNGRVVWEASGQSVYAGTTVDIECNPGYKLDGQSSMTCGNSGMWSRIGVTCSEEPEVRASFHISPGVKFHARSGNRTDITILKYHYGTLTVSCMSADETLKLQRYVVNGSYSQTFIPICNTSGCYISYREQLPYNYGRVWYGCEVDGASLAWKYMAEVVDGCEKPHENSYIILHPDEEVYKVNSYVMHRCEDGYQRKGKRYRMCRGNNFWSDTPPYCSS